MVQGKKSVLAQRSKDEWVRWCYNEDGSLFWGRYGSKNYVEQLFENDEKDITNFEF